MSVDDAYRRRDEAFNAMTEANKGAVNVRAASKERQEVMYSNGTDVQYRTFPGATDEEVWAANKKAYAAQKAYEQAKKDVRMATLSPEEIEERKEQRKKEEQQRKEEEKAEHKHAFENVKRIYKAQSRVQRFMNLVQGKKPNWKKVENYTTKELNFLDTLSRGRSAWQEKRNEERRIRREAQGMSLAEMRKLERERNMKDFTNSLNSQTNLESAIKSDNFSRGIAK